MHPYAELFPPMSPPEFDSLCGAILIEGLQEEIVVHEGKILDGRHRYLACLAKGVPPRFRPYAGECGSPLAFVVAKNVRRRHLTESQRALLAARLKPLFEEDARQRQHAALRKGKEPPVGLNSGQRENHKENSRSAKKVAQLMKVSRFSVNAADKVQKQGIPQLLDALAAGKISVSAASRIAGLPAEQQQAVVAAVASGLKPNQALAQVKDPLAKDGTAWVDDGGRPVPERVLPAFRQRDQLRTLCRRIESLGREVKCLSDSPVGVHLDVEPLLASLGAVRKALWAAQPARVCQHEAAEQARCNLCGGNGWLPQAAAV
jgi:ParB-like chromosome segregation protein Spo0J